MEKEEEKESLMAKAFFFPQQFGAFVSIPLVL